MVLKRITALLIMLITVFCSFSLSACSSELTDDELIDIFKKKYDEAYSLNEYIWGDGLPTVEYDASVTVDPYYVEVSEQAEYQTKAELIAAINSVYVSDLASGEITELLFTGYGEDEPAPLYSEKDGKLTVNVKAKGFDLVGKFLTETAVVKKARGNTFVVTVTYEREGKSFEDDIMMRREGDTWKFEAPVY